MTLTIEDAPSSGSEGQRRYLALLFADLSHSTSLGAAMEAEDYAALLAGWRAACREIIPRHGGIIARMQGDGVLALFGYPEARENDGRRATEAALDLHAAVGALGAHAADGAPLTVHSGIHGGWVLVSNGDIELGRFELLGDAPNIAARLSTLADADDILVSEETLGPHGQFFTTGDRTELSLKGRSERLAVYRVLGRADADARSRAKVRRGLSPFVGREQALRQLREALRLAMNGTPQCVALYGGPGMGKTRLVDELLRHAAAASCRVLRGYCESYLNAEPVQPFAQMLRALQCEEQRDPALDAVMAQAAAEGVGAMPSLLGALAQQRPLLVVIDDWQWADVASQLMLDGVLAARHPLCVVLLSRSRPDDLPSPANSVIELPPLDDADAAAIVRHLLPDADPFLVAEIHRYAGGMPLFLEELCRSAAARGSAGLAAPQTRGLAWLNGLIESRVENLPAEQAALVRAAAVMGNVFPDWLLECITGHGAHSPAVSALAAGDFLFPGEQAGTLRFKHGITRDVIYAAVGLHERKALHRRIALALQARDGTADDLPEALAYHCAAGALHPEAAQHAERAGDKAMAASALDRARAQYGAAL
ncbi:MAG: AAA family ATPase, partial [Rhizobiales bacterium]|nr:AAA family ATPase [Rhizobacter sp.]